MGVSKIRYLSVAFGLALLVGTAGAPAANAAGKVIFVSSNPPQPINRFRPPVYGSAYPGATSSRSFDKGNWRYTLIYKYTQQSWHATQYEARRIHKNTEPALARFTQTTSACSIGTRPKAEGRPPSGYQANSLCTKGAPPDPGDLPAPALPIGNPISPGSTTTVNYPNYAGSGWTVIATWEWENGHWVLIYVLERRDTA